MNYDDYDEDASSLLGRRIGYYDNRSEKLVVTYKDLKEEFPKIEAAFKKAAEQIQIPTGVVRVPLGDERVITIPRTLSLVDLTCPQIALINSILNEGEGMIHGSSGAIYRTAPLNQVIDLFVKGHLTKENLPTANQGGYGGFLTGTDLFRFRSGFTYKSMTDVIGVVHGSNTIDKWVEPIGRKQSRDEADSIYDLKSIAMKDANDFSSIHRIPIAPSGLADIAKGFIGGGSMLMLDYDEFIHTSDKILYGEVGKSGEHGRFGVAIDAKTLKFKSEGAGLIVEADIGGLVDDPFFVAVSGGLERARAYADKLKSLGISKFELGRPYTSSEEGGTMLCIDLFGSITQRTIGLNYPHNHYASIFLERIGPPQ